MHFGDGKGTVYGFAIGDLNGDGIQDIAVARSDAPNVVYFGARAAERGPDQRCGLGLPVCVVCSSAVSFFRVASLTGVPA